MFDYVNTKYEDAILIINESTAQKAIDIINKTIEEKGETAELLCYLSKAYLFLNNKEESLKYAQNALRLDKNYLYAKARIMLAYAKLNNKTKALEIFNELNKYDVKDINILIFNLMVVVYDTLSENKSCNALTSFKKYKKQIYKSKKFNTFEYEVLCFYSSVILCQMESALYIYLLAKRNNKLSDRIYTFISYIMQCAGDFKHSLIYANKALKLNPKNYIAIDMKAEILISAGKFQQALNFLNKIENKTNWQEKFFEALQIVINDEKSFLKTIAKSGSLVYKFALGFYTLKKYDIALISLLYSNVKNWKKTYALSLIYEMKKEYKIELKYLYEFLPETQLFYKKGRLKRKLNVIRRILTTTIKSVFDFRKNIPEYEKLVKESEEKNLQSYMLYSYASEINKQSGNYKNALKYINKAYKYTNELNNMYKQRAKMQIFLLAGKYEKALKIANELKDSTKESDKAIYILERLITAKKENNYKKAVDEILSKSFTDESGKMYKLLAEHFKYTLRNKKLAKRFYKILD